MGPVVLKVVTFILIEKINGMLCFRWQSLANNVSTTNEVQVLMEVGPDPRFLFKKSKNINFINVIYVAMESRKVIMCCGMIYIVVLMF